LDTPERRELIDDLLKALDERHAGEGAQLLDLMRAEQNLVDTLAVIRKLIDVIVRTATSSG
jgi:hypothetical protein